LGQIERIHLTNRIWSARRDFVQEVILAKGIELSRDFDACNCVVPSRTITQTTELTPAAWVNRNASPTSSAL
jgi:hypothetical protein